MSICGRDIGFRVIVLLVSLSAASVMFANENVYPAPSVLKTELAGAVLHVYKPPFKAKRVFVNLSDVTNNSVEELFQSIASESNQEWLNFNNSEKMQHSVDPGAFQRRLEKDPDANFLELIHRFDFTYDGTATSVVKYWLVDDGNRTLPMASTVQFIDGRWIRTSVSGLHRLERVVGRVQTDIFRSLLRSVPPESDGLLKDVYQNTRHDIQRLDIDKLYEVMMSLRHNGDQFEVLFDVSR